MAATRAGRVFDLVALRLPWTVGKEQLEQHFLKFGKLKNCLVVFDDETGFSKGFGFVKFEDAASIQNALDEKNHIIDGKRIDVDLKNPDGQNKFDGNRRPIGRFSGINRGRTIDMQNIVSNTDNDI